jgi:hypothetical protein
MDDRKDVIRGRLEEAREEAENLRHFLGKMIDALDEELKKPLSLNAFPVGWVTLCQEKLAIVHNEIARANGASLVYVEPAPEAVDREKVFRLIESGCPEKMDVVGNIECRHQRGFISGLGRCLCEPSNCHLLRDLAPSPAGEVQP